MTATATATDEAIRFVTDIVDDVDLLRGYLTALKEVADKPDSDDTGPVDAFLKSKGYDTTAADVVAAQAVVEGQQIAYWSGFYDTYWVADDNTRTAAPPLTINPEASGMHRIGFGAAWLIEPEFAQNTLVWANTDSAGDTVNDTAGELVFVRTNLENGVISLAFSGTVTDATGKRQLVGVRSDVVPDKPPANTPPGQDLDLMKLVVPIVGAAVSVLGLAAVLITVLKGRLEMKKLSLEIDKLTREGDDDAAKRLAAEADEKENVLKPLDGYLPLVKERANRLVGEDEPLLLRRKASDALKLDADELIDIPVPDPKISARGRESLNSLIIEEYEGEQVGVKGYGTFQKGSPLAKGELDEDVVLLSEED